MCTLLVNTELLLSVWPPIMSQIFYREYLPQKDPASSFVKRREIHDGKWRCDSCHFPAMPWTSRTLSTWRVSSTWIILSIPRGLWEHFRAKRWQVCTRQGLRCNAASQHHETISFHTCWGSPAEVIHSVLSKVCVMFKAAREICIYFTTLEIGGW